MSEKGFLLENCISQGTWKLLRSRARRGKVSFAVRRDRDTERTFHSLVAGMSFLGDE